MIKKILITFAFPLILIACQPSHIQQQEVRLEDAIQKHDLIAQYDALKILVGHAPKNWNEAFSQVKKTYLSCSKPKLCYQKTSLSTRILFYMK